MGKLIDENFLSVQGLSKATRYSISPTYQVIQPIDIKAYYEKEIDDREIIEAFNFEIINDVLAKHSVFTESGLLILNQLQSKFVKNISQ